MSNIERLGSRLWWRFNRYEVADGYVRPQDQALLGDYDLRRRGQGRRAYLELVEAVSEVPDKPVIFAGPLARFDPNYKPVMVPRGVVRRVVNWCNKFGLLGLLLHDLVQVRVENTVILRQGADWIRQGYLYEPDEEPVAEIVRSNSEWAGTYGPEEWFHYFPNVPHAEWSGAQVLVPCSESFWRAYQEPINDIVAYALSLRNVVAMVKESPARRRQRQDLTRGLQDLNTLALPVRMELVAGVGSRPQRSWSSPSLLGHLAMQMMEDLVGDQRLVECAACKRIVPTLSGRRMYCSKRCATRMHVREKRRRDRGARRPGVGH